MKFGVVIFPGSNCDRDTVYVLKDILEQEVVTLWHKETDFDGNIDVIILPGGFSYGDYLRCGAIAANSPVLREVKARAEQGMAAGTPFALAHSFGQSGPFRPRNVDRRVPGLVFAGSSTTPGVGIPMVLISGKLAARRVQEALR